MTDEELAQIELDGRLAAARSGVTMEAERAAGRRAIAAAAWAEGHEAGIDDDRRRTEDGGS